MHNYFCKKLKKNRGIEREEQHNLQKSIFKKKIGEGGHSTPLKMVFVESPWPEDMNEKKFEKLSNTRGQGGGRD